MKLLFFIIFFNVMFSSSNGFAAAPMNECPKLLEYHVDVLTPRMKGFWSTLDAEEQLLIANRIARFWNNRFLHSKIPLIESYSIFLGLMEYTFRSSFEKWPDSYSSLWLTTFLEELRSQPNTTEDAKSKFEQVISLISAH